MVVRTTQQSKTNDKPLNAFTKKPDNSAWVKEANKTIKSANGGKTRSRQENENPKSSFRTK